jgi:hypothetical protein
MQVSLGKCSPARSDFPKRARLDNIRAPRSNQKGKFILHIVSAKLGGDQQK